jgi:hypothetical protein
VSPAAVIIGFAAAALLLTVLVAQIRKPGLQPTQVLGTQTHRPSPNVQATDVSDLLGYSLIAGDAGSEVAVVQFSGNRRAVTGFVAPGYPEVPVRSGHNVVVVMGRTAFVLTAPYTSPPLTIGPADHVFPALAENAIGIWRVGQDTARPTVQVAALPGSGASSSAIAPFPPGLRPLAELTSGILVWDESSPGGALRVWRPASDGGTGTFTRSIGQASAVVGSSGDKVAWLAAAGCTSNGECPLHVTDAGTGADATVAPPPGFAGYLPGGAFSPVSDQLFGVFVFNPVQHTSAARLVLVSLAAANSNRPRWTPVLVPQGDVPLVVKGPPLTAVWTPDGTHVLFSGDSGRIHDYRLGQTASYPTEQPASESFTVVGESALSPSPTGR